jgi:threonylcarbamoyladenosine tRNA methylthiotransferase MtaB
MLAAQSISNEPAGGGRTAQGALLSDVMPHRPGPMRIFLETNGCKLNQAETESLAWQLAASGHHVVAGADEADVYVLNTCTVTGTADAKVRRRLRAFHQRNPRALIVATGCYAQREPETLASIPGVGLVVSNADKSSLPALLDGVVGEAATRRTVAQGDAGLGSMPPSLRTRSFLKVQDGCRGACAYCIVPVVRSEERSVPADRVLAEVQQRLARGIREIVLTGTEVGAYADGGLSLKDLLTHILAATPVPRLRLSSLQPSEISPALLSRWSDPRLCPHFHLSVQSGSDATLRAMRRRYSVADFARSLSLIRKMVPRAAITTDVIVGFPGETEIMFEESYQLCREWQFARIHVFPYSPRPGTAAASFPGRVDSRVKRARTERMLSLAEESSRSFRAAFQGQTRPVLWERRDEGGMWTGFTDNYIPVKVRSAEDLENRITPFTVD